MFQYPHGNFPSSGRLFSRGKLRLAHFLSQCNINVWFPEMKLRDPLISKTEL
jgi:hypothetical protein